AGSDTELDRTGPRCPNPALPAPRDELPLKVRCRDGALTVEDLSARLGPTGVSVKVEIDAPPAPPDFPAVVPAIENFDERVRRLEVTVTDLTICPDPVEPLPPNLPLPPIPFHPAPPAGATHP